MTERTMVELTCDRCRVAFERAGDRRHEDVVTARYGVFYLKNGSGSRANTSGRGDLDQDLCDRCTPLLRRFLDGEGLAGDVPTPPKPEPKPDPPRWAAADVLYQLVTDGTGRICVVSPTGETLRVVNVLDVNPGRAASRVGDAVSGVLLVDWDGS
jgi:hypothetical protein